MSDNVENLVLEHLRSIRADMSKMADHMMTMQAEMTALRHSMESVRALQNHDHGDIAAIKLRLDRIERRLELVN